MRVTVRESHLHYYPAQFFIVEEFFLLNSVRIYQNISKETFNINRHYNGDVFFPYQIFLLV